MGVATVINSTLSCDSVAIQKRSNMDHLRIFLLSLATLTALAAFALCGLSLWLACNRCFRGRTSKDLDLENGLGTTGRRPRPPPSLPSHFIRMKGKASLKTAAVKKHFLRKGLKVSTKGKQQRLLASSFVYIFFAFRSDLLVQPPQRQGHDQVQDQEEHRLREARHRLPALGDDQRGKDSHCRNGTFYKTEIRLSLIKILFLR